MLDLPIMPERLRRLVPSPNAAQNSKGILRNRKITAVVIAVCLAAAGCAQRWEVEPGALDDVRQAGAIIWEQADEGYMGEDIDVSHVLVVNVGGGTEQMSISNAIASLRRRGWNVSLNSLPNNVVMQSSKWPGARLAIYAFGHSQEHTVPDVIGAIRKQGVQPAGLVSVVAYQSE